MTHDVRAEREPPVAGVPAPCGFFRRLLALAVDGLVLGILGLVLGLASGGMLRVLGPWGRLVGLAIALAYFASLNSKLFGGQTLGKRLLGIRVVGVDAQPISLGRSAARALVLLPPHFFNGMSLPLPLSTVGAMLLGVIVFGGGGALVYLYVFNRRTRQSLHDLASRTVVVPARAMAEQRAPMARLHLWVAGGIGALALCASVVVPALAPAMAPDTWRALERLSAVDGLYSVQVGTGSRWTRRSGGQTATTTYTYATARSTGVETEFPATALQVAEALLETLPEAQTSDSISVTIRYGYQIGIAGVSTDRRASHAPEEWRRAIEQAASAHDRPRVEE